MAAIKHTSADPRIRDKLAYCPENGVFTWRSTGKRAGRKNRVSGYRYVCVLGITFLEHRLAWWFVHGEMPASILDHVNRTKDDNRIANLRLSDYSANGENMLGKPCRKVAPYPGIRKQPTPSESWAAKITVRGKTHYLGTFATPEAAHEAYMAAKRRLHPAFQD